MRVTLHSDFLTWDITHTPNHWSNEDTMERYFENMIVPYVTKKREELKLAKDFPALMIFDCFKGQVTEGFLEKLEQHNLHHVIVPANCTDRLQPLDVSITKHHVKKQFQLWYSERINEQLDQGTTVESITPVDMRMSIMKPLGAKWLVATTDYIKTHPAIIINGFKKTGITDAASPSN